MHQHPVHQESSRDSAVPPPGGPAGAPPSDATFALVFQQAVKARGLSLDRVRNRLAEQGIRISLTTLSYWQRGRSEPERAGSLRAVDALEEILALPTGTLRSLIGPYRPRGRVASQAHDLRTSHRVFGENSLAEQILGDDFGSLNEDIGTLSIRETVTIDENRRLSAIAIQQVLRATRDGADRLTAVHTFDSGARAVRTTVRCGIQGQVRFLPEVSTVVTEIEFGSKLAKNETAVIDYTISVDPGDGRDDHYERRTRVRLREYLLHVYFHPAALPVVGHRYYRERSGARKSYNHRVVLDASHTVHAAAGRCPAGIHGISWEWPGADGA
ncbi:XRE family transcriptional regulator [Streptomyces corynorhini]|uniref:XRE family transcriptional regulator n=1 Tax=Streptomyces corynorhini TaxID=2282652 RepID=A0A370BD53_9ACTN|nr:XRE family transcriptional regulator [Streptomyces corynorhini]RDG37385.1 XRE family transcriptional regulator [Streptomyces corynorhini]